MWGMFSFLLNLLHQKIFPNFCLLKFSWIKKLSQMLYFLKMYDDNNGRTIVNFFFTNFLAQKTIGKKNLFSNFWFQEMSLKREIFVNFLPQKYMTKYGIVWNYSVTFVSQKILTCLQCLKLQPGVNRHQIPVYHTPL